MVQFPLFKTKTKNVSQKFDLTDVEQRKQYFELKAGHEIRLLRAYLKENTFIAYLLGKKNSGKGTYAKMFKEVVAPDRVEHFSIGDMVRELDAIVHNGEKKARLVAVLQKNYRGFLPLDDIMAALESRSTKVLLPSELILALVKMKIGQAEKKALFIDGFPRNMDQISYSLFFRDLVGYRDDPDVFVLIDVPEAVIDERIKYRVVCPVCQTSRNTKLLATKKVGYDPTSKKFYLVCDNTACSGERMVPKEGDEFGIEPIRERLKLDHQLIEQAFALHGMSKVLLRNSVPIAQADEFVDDYELTPAYAYELKEGGVQVAEKPWQIQDDDDLASYSLLPPPVVVSLIKQMAETLAV